LLQKTKTWKKKTWINKCNVNLRLLIKEEKKTFEREKMSDFS
jgi:hypothetical protein